MLVLSRKPNDRILIGDDIVVKVIRIGPNNVRLGIDAPTDVKIFREELLAENDLETKTNNPMRKVPVENGR